MRSDMAKVIVERPRRGSGAATKRKGYERELTKAGADNLPRREGMKRRGGGTKEFNEHLGPLRRYLQANVGRPWNKVYAEICANIDRGNVVQKHILTHVFDYVATHVVLLEGVPCHGDGRWYGQPIQWGWTAFYVCPRSGLLRQLPRRSRKRRTTIVEDHKHVRLDAQQVCIQFDGAWHLVQVRSFSLENKWEPLQASTAYDSVLKKYLTIDQARQVYGAPVYGVSSRRLSSREMRQLPIPLDWQQ
jgi:hypothetical protein